MDLTYISGPILPLNFSSPVFAPDGSVVYSISGEGGGAQSGLFRLTIHGSVAIQHPNSSLTSVQLSTPAVDSAGFVYVSQFVAKEKSTLLVQPSDFAGGLTVPVVGSALAPPKVLEVNGGRLIFYSYLAYQPIGQHVRILSNTLAQNEHITDSQTSPKTILDQGTCSAIEGPGGIDFQVPGIELGPPYPEDPAVAIRLVKTGRGKKLFLVVPANRCGISFYIVNLAENQTDPPTLTTINVRIIDRYFSSPVITPDGTVIIDDSEHETTAYDVATGNEKWHFDSGSFVSATPVLAPLGINAVYIASYDKLTKLDYQTGQVLAQVFLPGLSDASPAIGGQHIFVSTVAGLSTYDLDLKLLAFTPLAGGQSSPVIDTDTGQVCVASTDGKFYVFPSP